MALSKVKHYYKRVIVDNYLSDLGFTSLSPEATGIYMRLWLMAAKTDNSGSIHVGKVKMDRKMLVSWVIEVSGYRRPKAQKIVDELLVAEMLTLSRSGVVTLPKYVRDQVEAPSPAAAKKRKARAAAKEREELENMGESLDPRGPASRAPGQSQSSVQNRGTCPPTSGGTCPPITDNVKLKEDTSVSLNTDAETEKSPRVEKKGRGSSVSDSGAFGAGPGAREAGPYDDPVRRACLLTGEFDTQAVNVYSARLRELQSEFGEQAGRDYFHHALNVLEGEVKRGVKFRKSASAYLQGVIRKLKEGGHL